MREKGTDVHHLWEKAGTPASMLYAGIKDIAHRKKVTTSEMAKKIVKDGDFVQEIKDKRKRLHQNGE
jgi:hypothetical protein